MPVIVAANPKGGVGKSTACLVLAAAGMSCGCRSKDLVFTTYTKVGLHMTAEGTTPTSLQFGYKRFEGAIIPVDPAVAATNGVVTVAPIYAAVSVTNGWFSGIAIRQVFATGAAATNTAATGIIE